MPGRAGGETTATLDVSGCAPPTPSICRGSGDPMTRSSRSSRSATSAGRSSARKYSPLDVPPRICMARIPSTRTSLILDSSDPLAGPLDVLGVGDVVDLGQLWAEAVHVQAEDALGELLAVAVLLGDPGLGCGDRLRDVGAWHDTHAVVVGDDRVARPAALAAESHRHVHRARRLLHRALRGHVRGPRGG